MLVVLLLPMTLVVLLQGSTAPSAHAFPIDDFGDSIRLTFDPAVTTNISSTVDVDGNMHVVWEDYRSGNGDIYYVKLDPEGNKLTNDAKISNDSALSRHPSVAVDSGGHIYVVWEDWEGGTSELSFAKLWYYAGNITFEVNGLQVSDSDPANSTEPDIAVCADGNLAIVWTDARHISGNNNLEIYYKRLRTAGTSLTPDTRITGDVGVSERPQLDLDPSGMIHIVWYDFRDSDNGQVINHGVFYRKVLPDGTPLTNETRITFASPESRPDVAVDTDGNVHVAFDDDRYESFDVFYTLLDANGSTIVDDRNISPKDPTESRYPRIALSDSNAVDVVWQDNQSGKWAVHYSAMSYSGNIEVYDQTLSSESAGNATLPTVICAKDNNTLVLFVGDAVNEEMYFARTHRPDPCVMDAWITISTPTPLVDSTIWVNATVMNLEGDVVDDLVVRLLVGSSTEADETVDILEAGATAVVTFSYVVEAGDSDLWVVVDPDQELRETDEDNNVVHVPIVVRIPGVSLTADALSLQAAPGGVATFNLNISNEGSAEFTYILTATEGGEGWDVDLGGSPYATYTVPAASFVIAPIQISVPEDEPPGSAMYTITATCTERESVSANITLMVDVVRVGDVSIVAPSGGTVEPTIPITYSFSISNEANSNDTFDLTIDDLRGWNMALSISSVELTPGEQVNFTATLVPNRYDTPGTLNTITVTASSRNLTENHEDANVLCLVGHHWEVDIAMDSQTFLNVSVPETRQIIYEFSVTNLGNSEDVFGLNLTGISSFWAMLNTTYAFLDPAETQYVRLILTPGLNVLAGLYFFNVSIASESNHSANDTLHLAVSVMPFYSIHSYVDIPAMTVRPGTVVFVNVTVENWGNIVDIVDAYFYFETFNSTTAYIEGGKVDFVDGMLPPMAIDPGDAVTITFRIPVQGNSEIRTHEMYMELSSMSDPAVTDAVSILITVQKPRSWFNIYTIMVIVAIVVAIAVIAFLYMRMRAQREAEEAAEQRRRMQAKKRPPGPPRQRPKPP